MKQYNLINEVTKVSDTGANKKRDRIRPRDARAKNTNNYLS